MTVDYFTEHVQALILQGISLLTILTPLIEKLAAVTENKVDDKLATVLRWVADLLPRISFGGRK